MPRPPRSNAPLTATRLREVLLYDLDTGRFTRRRTGALAGTDAGAGYWQTRVDGILYKNHRLAWLYVYGKWPELYLDHINGQRDDNRIANLREVAHRENLQNRRPNRRPTRSGAMGVDWSYPKGGWRARISLNGKSHVLGYFATVEEASAAYVEAKRRMHPFSTI